MTIIQATVAGAALAALAATGCATASDGGAWPRRHALPPLSGTIHLPRAGFGSAAPAHRRRYMLQDANRLTEHRFGEPVPRFAYGQPRRLGYGQGSVYWNRQVPYYGEGNATLAMTVTGWGTADSATTGGAYPLPSPRSHAAFPVQFSYGTPGFGYGRVRTNRGYAPTGGLATYSSGSPGQMAYYSSSSSAGPGGSPGGLGFYSSGAFGSGPKVIDVGGRQANGWSEGDAGGARIIHVGHRAPWPTD